MAREEHRKEKRGGGGEEDRESHLCSRPKHSICASNSQSLPSRWFFFALFCFYLLRSSVRPSSFSTSSSLLPPTTIFIQSADRKIGLWCRPGVRSLAQPPLSSHSSNPSRRSIVFFSSWASSSLLLLPHLTYRNPLHPFVSFLKDSSSSSCCRRPPGGRCLCLRASERRWWWPPPQPPQKPLISLPSLSSRSILLPPFAFAKQVESPLSKKTRWEKGIVAPHFWIDDDSWPLVVAATAPPPSDKTHH